MIYIRAAFAVIGGLLGIYMFRVFRSAFSLYLKEKRTVFCISVAAAMAAVLPLPWFFDGAAFWGLCLLHFIVLSAVLMPLNAFLRRMENGKPKRVFETVFRLQVLPVVITAALLIYGSYNIKNLKRTEYRVEAGLGKETTIAVIADIHYGAVADAEYLRQTVAALNAETPDMVLICGDIADEGTKREELEEMFVILGGLQAKSGVYYVFGNHDFSLYSDSPNYTPQELRAAAARAGIVVLEDRTVRPMDGVVLIGRKDYSADRLPVEKLTQGVGEDEYVIVADHQPVEFKEKAAAGVDLQISGHTHGGQIFPIGLISTLISSNDMNYGMKTIDGMIAIVSSGVSGWSFPVRTQGRSEYVIIKLA